MNNGSMDGQSSGAATAVPSSAPATTAPATPTIPTTTASPAAPASQAPAPTTTPATEPVTTTPSTPTRTASEQIEQNIVAYFKGRLHELLAPEPITLHNLEQRPEYSAYRAVFLRFLREDKITTADEDAYLKTLPAPIDTIGDRAIFDKISHNPLEKQILAIFTGFNETNWNDIVAANVASFLAAPHHKTDPDYRTPVGFADLRRKFLTEVKSLATTDQLDAYTGALNSLEEHLYGDRFASYREFEHLRQEARALSQDIDLTLENATRTDYNLNPEGDLGVAPTAADRPEVIAVTSATPDAIDPSLPTSHLTPISDEHRDQLLSHAVIDGSPWRQGSKDYVLTAASLSAAGLIPKYELNLGDRTIYLTNLFTIVGDQLAALAFVPVVTEVKVRAYYRDKNYGLWRYLPDYIRDISGEGIMSFGIGFDERSTILPIEIQAALEQIERNRGLLDLTQTNPTFLFAGTAPAYATRQEFRDAYSRGTLKGDFYHEVSSTAANAEARNLIGLGRKKSAPQLLSTSADAMPNFNQMIAHYSAYSAFAGQIMGEGFWSVDRNTKWLFMSDYRGRSWVANIDTTAPTTSTGCRKEWLLPTDLATPLYESSILADTYGDSNDIRAGSYLSMWDNYLSHIPLIQQYAELLAARRKPTSPGTAA